MADTKFRLFVDHPLAAGKPVPVDRDQANYLFNVMRLRVGSNLLVFNGRDGEWRAEVAEAGKRRGLLLCHEQTRPLRMPPDLWLCFAPIKKARTDFIVEKAVELGVARIIPIQSDHTNSERIRQDRLQAHAVGAAEQCGATYVPEVSDLIRLPRLIDGWNASRSLIFCDETKTGPGPDLAALSSGPSAILIGPEGGFSDEERACLNALPQTTAIGLGPRILRADTAAVAALTLWQSTLGDWR